MIPLHTLGRALAAAAHPPGAPEPYVAVSAAVDGTPPDIAAQLHSPAHEALRRETPGGEDAQGVWADGGEASRVLPHGDLHDAARLGLRFDQKTVLHWVPGPGPHVEHRALVPASVEDATRHFAAYGIQYLTAIPRGDATEVRVVDPEHVLGESFDAAAKHYGVPTQHTPGTATFLGDWDDRAKAAEVFRRVLRS